MESHIVFCVGGGGGMSSLMGIRYMITPLSTCVYMTQQYMAIHQQETT